MAKSPDKAYKNLDFLNSKEARLIRILSEYLEPRVRFAKEGVDSTIVFFGSARLIDEKDAQKKVAECADKYENNPTDENAFAKKRAEKMQEMSGYYEDARTLAKMLTEWSLSPDKKTQKYVIASGGGPGIMDAANRGASEVPNGRSVGLNISLPMEQGCNPYISDELNFEFHYFFTRKFWFIYLAKAMVVFPGGFGTLDELFESLTLIQTKKLSKRIPIVLYGSEYWKSLINFDKFVENCVINPEDLKLMHFADTPDEAFKCITKHIL